jgi:hypothetical protein
MNTNKMTEIKTDKPEQMKVNRDDVAQRAYQLWEAAGQPLGRDLEYWLQAEAEFLASRRSARSPGAGVSGSATKRKSTQQLGAGAREFKPTAGGTLPHLTRDL